jgi:hypothetical protein
MIINHYETEETVLELAQKNKDIMSNKIAQVGFLLGKHVTNEKSQIQARENQQAFQILNVGIGGRIA